MSYRRIMTRNREWVLEVTRSDPAYFERLAAEQRPQFLFIGCSDSRVPASVITQTQPGEMFVHRNIANQVVPTDTNLLAVVQYAVEVLRVTDVFVCGHFGCGGVKAAMGEPCPTHVDNWLSQIRTIQRLHRDELAAIDDPHRRYERLIELNVAEQVHNLSTIPSVQAAWSRGATLRLHGWVYELREGLLHDLGVTVDGTHGVVGELLSRTASRGGRSGSDRVAGAA